MLIYKFTGRYLALRTLCLSPPVLVRRLLPNPGCCLIPLAGNSASSVAWYNDLVDRPVKRLKQELKGAFPAWNVSLPSDSKCILTATTNVFGRFLNGIDPTSVCVQGSDSHLASGQFVHAEQSIEAVSSASYSGWSTALKNAFGTTCAPGHATDPLTNLCV